MNLRKTFFILPNLFTLASVFCGFYAISLCAGPPSVDALYQAALALCFAFFFDIADGRVARLTKTQSELGLQLDSLADVISFGAAPALLVYKWGLQRFELAGVFICFCYCGSGALRLARFNVLAMKADSSKPGKFILGLPVPGAASVLISLVLLNHQLQGSFVDVGHFSLAALMLVLSYLMVSRIRFRSFKDLRLNRRTVLGVTFLVAIALVLWRARFQSAFIFIFLITLYVGLGLFEEVIFYRRRRAEHLLEKQSATAPPLEAEGGATSDEEVLEELGAYEK